MSLLHTVPFIIKFRPLPGVTKCSHSLLMSSLSTDQSDALTTAGLSVAKIDSVEQNSVTFRGADVVDGTPVLDIKPYIPYVDGGVAATAPDWVSHP